MSSMVRISLIAALSATTVLASPAPVQAQDASEWDRNRANLVAEGPGRMAPQIARWERLYEDSRRRSGGEPNPQLSFIEYADFLNANPGFPDEEGLRASAEQRLRMEFTDPQLLLGFFAQHDPVTNYAKAHYALALMGPDRAAAER